MTAATAATTTSDRVMSGRRFPRCPIATPVDVVVLRGGVPVTVPGRSVNLGEGGVAGVFAGELRAGQSVGLQLVLPDESLLVRTKATVKYNAKLLCGLEFQGLSRQHREVLRKMVGGAVHEGPQAKTTSDTSKPDPDVSGNRRRWLRSKLVVAIAMIFVAILATAWWTWQSSWRHIETQPSPQLGLGQTRAHVPAEVIQGYITHRVDPIYPEALRPTGVRGTVVLSAVISRDGTVLDLRPISGPDALFSAATDAVKWWRFQPYRMSGQPVEVETAIAVDFIP